MHADEIRKMDASMQTAFLPFLREIAAQLAELNQNLRDIHPELHLPEICRKHECDYYVSYLAHGAAEMSHEAYHDQVKQAAQHMRACVASNLVSVCKRCENFEQRLRY